MNVGELFVKIGVQGADKASKEISGMGRALTDVSAKGLAAKAAVLGLVYGVTKLVTGAATVGQSLFNFGINTGKSTDELQRWAVSLREGGASLEDVRGSVENLQRNLGEMAINGKPIFGLDEIQKILGNVDVKRLQDGDIFYAMQMFRDFAKSEPNVAVRNDILSQNGMGGSIEAGLIKGRDVSGIGSNEGQLSEKQIERAHRMNVQLQTLTASFQKFQMGVALAFGPQLLSILQNAFTGVNKLIKSFTDMTKQAPQLATALKVIGVVIAFYFAPLTTIVAGLIYLLSEFNKLSKGQDNIFSDVNKKLGSYGFTDAPKAGPTPEGADRSYSWLKDVLISHGLAPSNIPGINSPTVAIPSASRGVPSKTLTTTAQPGTHSNNFNINISGVEQRDIPDATVTAIQKYADGRIA